MEPTATALGLDLSLISYNGAAVCGRLSEKRERLFHRPLPTGIAADLYAYAREHDLQLNYYIDDLIHSEDGPTLRPWQTMARNRTRQADKSLVLPQHFKILHAITACQIQQNQRHQNIPVRPGVLAANTRGNGCVDRLPKLQNLRKLQI